MAAHIPNAENTALGSSPAVRPVHDCEPAPDLFSKAGIQPQWEDRI